MASLSSPQTCAKACLAIYLAYQYQYIRISLAQFENHVCTGLPNQDDKGCRLRMSGALEQPGMLLFISC